MLEVNHLTKHFGGIAAVDDCSFRVAPNTITALIGPNGAGKTTVFNLLSGLVKEDAGEVVLNSQRIQHLPAYQRAQGLFSRTFQLNQVFLNMTVEENCLVALDLHDQDFWKNMFCRSGHREGGRADRGDPRSWIASPRLAMTERQKVIEVLQLLGMASQAGSLASLCSYGQQKLVGIARALLLPHTMLLSDEPVAGVNPKIRKEIGSRMLEMRKRGETILVIEHDMEFVMSIADRVIVMSEGRVLKEGSPKEIQNDPDVLEIYLGKK